MSQATTDKNQIVIGYWAIRGLAEPARLALHYTKTPYTDKMYVQGDGPEYSREEWLSEKQNLGLDFPNLPYLFDGDLKLTQSKAILYYLGRKLNLMGKTLNEEGTVMMLCEEAHDFRWQLNGIFYSPKGDSKEERKQYVETSLSDYLKKFDNYLGKSKTKFAVGDQPTIADFQLFEYIHAGLSLDDEHTLLDKYSNVKRLLETISTLPEIKDYIVKAHSQLPLNNKVATFGGKVIEQK
jgi:glutathione S-transferase